MVRIPAGIHKKTKHTNLETAANTAYVNKGTCYWAFTTMMSSIFYGEIKEERLKNWTANGNPYDILTENNRRRMGFSGGLPKAIY